jgi:hypothetical protein
MMVQPPWYRRSLRDDWHMLVYYLILVATVIISVLHFLVPSWGGYIAEIAPIIILVFVAVIATRLENRFESVLIKLGTVSEPVGTMLDKFDAKLEAVDDKFDAKIEAVDDKFDAKLEAVERNLIPLANVRFYNSQDETFRRLADMTWRADRVVKATRFSPGDITQAGDYWQEIKGKACDPNVRSIRIHSLAHPTKRPVHNLSKLVEQLKEAKSFQLGIAFFENEFEIIIADDQECIVCFHQPGEIIGNGLHFDSTLPKGEGIVDKFVQTFGDMRERCHVLVDFDEWVSTPDDISKLQAFINRAHDQYLDGTEPEKYGVDPEFLRNEVFS